jgi:precorrin-2 methylase
LPTVAFEYEVVPGISVIQALAARHRIALNRIGRSIHVMTARKIAEGLPNNIDDVVVMLDADGSFKAIGDADIDIYWGPYFGTEDEILVPGICASLCTISNECGPKPRRERDGSWTHTFSETRSLTCR